MRANRLSDMAEELVGAPSDLGAWCMAYLEELLVNHADQTARWLRNVFPGEIVEAGDVSALGSLVVRRTGPSVRSLGI